MKNIYNFVSVNCRCVGGVINRLNKKLKSFVCGPTPQRPSFFLCSILHTYSLKSPSVLIEKIKKGVNHLAYEIQATAMTRPRQRLTLKIGLRLIQGVCSVRDIRESDAGYLQLMQAPFIFKGHRGSYAFNSVSKEY